MSLNDKDHLLVIDNAVRTLDEVSSEMNKLIEAVILLAPGAINAPEKQHNVQIFKDKIKCCFAVKTELLLCDLLLNFSHPVQADASRENEEKSQEEFKNKN